MCICLNCYYLRKCTMYFIIENKHNEVHYNKFSTFYPQSPIVLIKFHYRKNYSNLEWDVYECLSFEEQPGNWLLPVYLIDNYKMHNYL